MSQLNSLREAFARFEGPEDWTMQHFAAAARIVRRPAPYSLRQCLDAVAGYSRVRVCHPPISLATQNVALFPTAIVQLPGSVGLFPLYKGNERPKVAPRLEEWLRAERPDVVIFTEFWVKAEKQGFSEKMRDL